MYAQRISLWHLLSRSCVHLARITLRCQTKRTGIALRRRPRAMEALEGPLFKVLQGAHRAPGEGGFRSFVARLQWCLVGLLRRLAGRVPLVFTRSVYALALSPFDVSEAPPYDDT